MRFVKLSAALLLSAALSAACAWAAPHSGGRSGNIYGVSNFKDVFGIERRLFGREMGIHHLDRRAYGAREFSNHVYGVRVSLTGSNEYRVRGHAFGSHLVSITHQQQQRGGMAAGADGFMTTRHTVSADADDKLSLDELYQEAIAKLPK
jgi:hypothetical protein